MDQLSMFDAPAAIKRPKRAISKWATSVCRPGIVEPIRTTIDVPRKRSEAAALLLGEFLPAFHDAVVIGDPLAQIEYMAQIKRVRCSGGTYEWQQGLLKDVRALDWQVPMWGQPGRMLLIVQGTEIDADYEGLFSYGGMSARTPDDQTFLRHFTWWMHDGSFIATGGLSLPEWLVEMAEADLCKHANPEVA